MTFLRGAGLAVLAFWLLAQVAGAQPLPRITLLKPPRCVELTPGSQATLDMMGLNLELFQYGQVMLDMRRIRAFEVELKPLSQDGTRRQVVLKASPEAEAGVYELRLFTPASFVVVPVEVRVR